MSKRKFLGGFIAAALVLGTVGVAFADTSATPNDTVTKAAFSPTAGTAGVANGATLSGAGEGSIVNIHVSGDTGSLFGASARLCKTGLDIQTASQLAPTQFGNCIPGPFVSGQDDALTNANSDTTKTFVDFSFRVGTGTQTFSANNGSSTITCDATTPCDLWVQESVSNAADGSPNVFKHFTISYAGAPGAPGITVTPGNQSLTVDLSAPSNTGNAPLGNYSVTVTGPGGATQTGAGTHYVFTGLTNFTNYSVSATASNVTQGGGTPAGFTSSAANGSGTPVPPAGSAPTGVPGDQKVTLTWSAPASGGTPTSYDVRATPVNPAGPPLTIQNSGSSSPGHVFTGLTNGTQYTFAERAVYGSTPGAFSAESSPITPNASLITQSIDVTRPQGALVLTQTCGPTHTAPTYNGGPDPLFNQYPYPVDGNGQGTASYPTDCAIHLGTASLITSGQGKGQFFRATGALNQVTVTDTRDSDPGFHVTGQITDFTDGAGHSFSGSELGWLPSATSTPGFTDSNGASYAQNVVAGPTVTPNFSSAACSLTQAQLETTPCGLSRGTFLGFAHAGSGLGIGTLDAALTLFIPITAHAAGYTATLSITAV